jgi:hypothetical protein
MNDNALGSLVAVCSILNKHAAEYLVVGGSAVILHGYFRYSTNAAGILADKPDLDFWYNPTYSNYFKILKVLEELGQNVSKFKAEQSPNPEKSFFRYEFEQFTLDLLSNLKAPLKFNTAFVNKETVVFSEIEIPFLNLDDLIADKAANARPKDLADIEQLKARQASEEE